MIYFLIFLIILLYLYINIDFNKKLKIYLANIFGESIKEDFKETFQDSNDKISQKEIDNILKYGFLPHNYNEYTNYNLEPKITNIDDLKEKENKNISVYLIYNRLNEINKVNETVFKNLNNAEEISDQAYNILTNNTARANYLANKNLTSNRDILNKDKIITYTKDEFKFLLKLLNDDELISDRSLKILLNSKIFNNMKIFKTLQNMYVDENQQFVVGDEPIEEDFKEDSLYALNYHSSPHFNENLYKLQSDKYPTHRRFLPPDWKCQRGEITRVNTKSVVEADLLECNSHLPYYDEFNYYKYLDNLDDLGEKEI